MIELNDWCREATGREAMAWVNPKHTGIHGKTRYIKHEQYGWVPITYVAVLIGLPAKNARRRLEDAITYHWTLEEFLSGSGSYDPPPHPEWMEFHMHAGKPTWRMLYDDDYYSPYELSVMTGQQHDGIRKRLRQALRDVNGWTPDDVVWGYGKSRPLEESDDEQLIRWLNGFMPCFGVNIPNLSR